MDKKIFLTENFKIRECKRGDYEVIHNITKNNMKDLVEKYWGGWSSKKFKSTLNKKNIKIVEYDNTIIGFYDIEPQKNLLHIRNMQLVSSFQGQGIGSFLMSLVEKEAKHRGFKKITLRVFKSNPAKEFYLKLGYKITKKDKNSAVMEKIILKS